MDSAGRRGRGRGAGGGARYRDEGLAPLTGRVVVPILLLAAILCGIKMSTGMAITQRLKEHVRCPGPCLVANGGRSIK